MKKVIIDARMVGRETHGIARYVQLMAEGLNEIADQDELPYLPVFLIQKNAAAFLKESNSVFYRFATCETESRFLEPSEWIEIPRILKQTEASLYHSPSFSSLWSSPCPWVMTLHDLNHLHFGGTGKKLYYRTLLHRFAKKASKLLTVSEFSRKEIAAWLEESETNIEVVPNALRADWGASLNQEESSTLLDRLGLSPNRYFFCLSNPKPHKNTELLIRAYEIYRARKSKSGATDILPLLMNLKSGPQVEGVQYLGPVSDLEAERLTRDSTACFFPSLYEGFGLPPVEAAALGARIVVSDIPVHREGLADLAIEEAIWIDPRKPELWADAMQRAGAVGLHPVSEFTRKTLLRHYSPLELGRSMDRIYRSLLEPKAENHARI